MGIYSWWGSQKYAGLIGVSKEDERKVCWFDKVLGDPLPPLSKWATPQLKQYLGEGKNRHKPRPLGDSPSAMIPVISSRAADALSDIFDRHAWLYPVMLKDAPGETFYMV